MSIHLTKLSNYFKIGGNFLNIRHSSVIGETFFHKSWRRKPPRFSGWRKPPSFAKMYLCHSKPTTARTARIESITIWFGYCAIVKRFWLGLLRREWKSCWRKSPHHTGLRYWQLRSCSSTYTCLWAHLRSFLLSKSFVCSKGLYRAGWEKSLKVSATRIWANRQHCGRRVIMWVGLDTFMRKPSSDWSRQAKRDRFKTRRNRTSVL